MTPYYADDHVTLYHGDARDLLDLPADVLITDPPYGVKFARKHQSVSIPDASVLYADGPDEVRGLVASVVAPLIERIGRALVFPGTRLMFVYPEPAAVGGVFVASGEGLSSWGFQCVHPILYYGKDPFLADGKGGRPNGFRDEAGNPEKWDHPCPKPLSWMRWAVARASREGETVLDPFAGTGTTLAAAKALGRKAVGVELEERYCEQAAVRLSQEVLGLVA